MKTPYKLLAVALSGLLITGCAATFEPGNVSLSAGFYADDDVRFHGNNRYYLYGGTYYPYEQRRLHSWNLGFNDDHDRFSGSGRFYRYENGYHRYNDRRNHRWNRRH